MATRLLIGSDPSAPIYEFTRSDIKSRSLQIVTSVDVVGAELAADELYGDVDYVTGEYIWFSPADYDGVMTSDGYIFAASDQTIDLTQVPFATPVWLMDGNTVRHKLYFDYAERIDPQTYRLTAISGVGILERRRHKGNYYASATVSEVLAEIIGDAFTYTVDPTVGSQKVFGLLLPDTCRRNLHLLLFALGIAIVKGADGGIQFVYLTDTVAGTIPTSRVFLGGSISYQTPVTAVEVTEHSFYPRDNTDPVVIFDNNSKPTAIHTLVEFDNAYYNLTTTDSLTIEESGATYAIVSGVGTLSGVPYFHDTRIVHLDNPDPEGGQDIIQSDQDFLVNSMNSLSVARRLLSYYTAPKIVQLPVRLDGEKAGQNVNYPDPFGDGQETGFILGAETVVTGFEKAYLKIMKDYSPTGQGNYYSNRVLITSSGTWTVPSGVTNIRIALIGGGDGGAGGYDGEEGAGGEYDPDWGEYGDLIPYRDRDAGYLGYHYRSGAQPLKQGGAGGEPGTPGKSYVVDKEVVQGEVITISVGSGGTGGARNGEEGQSGTATTASSASLGSLSSALGTSTDSGFYDTFAGQAFAAAGRNGYDGMPGGQTDVTDLLGWNGAAGLSGGSFSTTYQGGAGGAGASIEDGDYRASGGGGGGAAYGASGGAGGAGTITNHDVVCGDGGAGADAAAPDQAFYGCGGDGGNGGGAGGNAAGGYSRRYYSQFNYNYTNGARGAAGKGSVGGQGGAGCVIIYY